MRTKPTALVCTVSSSMCSCSSMFWLPMPATCMYRSMPPSCAMSSSSCAGACGDVTSMQAVSTLSGAMCLSACSLSLRRAAMPMWYPRSSNKRLISNPRPDEAPIMTARFPIFCMFETKVIKNACLALSINHKKAKILPTPMHFVAILSYLCTIENVEK